MASDGPTVKLAACAAKASASISDRPSSVIVVVAPRRPYAVCLTMPPTDSALRHGVARACSSVSPSGAARMADSWTSR